MTKPLSVAFYVVLFAILLAIAVVVIRDGADIVAAVSKYIIGLFEQADIRPRNNRGFQCFFQLVIIAVFVGWTIRRFRQKK